MRIDSVKKFRELKAKLEKQLSERKRTIMVCIGTGCVANGSLPLIEALRKEIESQKIPDVDVQALKKIGCQGFCAMGPVVVIQPGDIFYCQVKISHVKKIVEKTLAKGEIIPELLYEDQVSHKRIEKFTDIDFYRKQHKMVLRNNGVVNPESIDDSIAHGGYAGLVKALSEMKPDQIIEEIKKSGLRGKGGAGFATGRKWETCARVDADTRYILANGDEGDPGAFMDRAIMEGDPHSVIEGMIIGAYAVGANQGYIYVREEYPLAVQYLGQAIDQAREYGLLGQNILGTDFSFDIKISRGGGAFVCGESTALMKSVAGEVGEPRAKYTRSVVKGLFDKPTVLNNVETWATVPVIINNGQQWFRGFGTEKSPGTKAFSLVGKVKNVGIIEIPMGTTLREIIFDIGGGIPNDRQFKAVQTGGPSGGCLPESMLDLPVDFDTLTEAGSMMGSGGMIVMDDRTCMVDVAKYFLKFLVDESCGKCVPCREGLFQIHQLLENIAAGKGKKGDLELIESLSDAIVKGSLCALGKSGPNPVLSTLQYFRDEWVEHIEHKRCPAGVCKGLIKYVINDKCNGCTLCAMICPTKAISGEKKEKHVIDQELCTKCGACFTTCQYDAIEVI
ncbi:NADH-quinone oxidoreductase subunit NuoF [bacterium]|nr:NADH-quinone oxidoreductase subunit NuoF [bacterium]